MENVYFLYELNLHGKSSHLNHLWRWTVMTSVTETSNRFISLLWRPINCNSSRASHLSHSKHSGGIPSSAASLSNPPLQEASIFGENCESPSPDVLPGQHLLSIQVTREQLSHIMYVPNALANLSPIGFFSRSGEALQCLASKAPVASFTHPLLQVRPLGSDG